jgi:glycosyltransferase involved in cell wall biosynthesis
VVAMKCSIIVPVYRNEENIPRLLEAIADMSRSLEGALEAVFVVDGSPDRSFSLLQEKLPHLEFPAQLVAHSRNFGSFPAIRTGLQVARGDLYGVMAADLQEPPELLITFFKELASGESDVVIGTRTGRDDPFLSRLSSRVFWSIYRRWVVREMPEGGVDVFGCNRVFRDHLLRFGEARSSLIALIFWLGFRRKLVGYRRLARQEGRSSWTLRKKVDYMMDSIFAFTDYPIRLLMRVGALGSCLSVLIGIVIVCARLSGLVTVPGYAATMLAVLFFGTLNILGLGLVGSYAWRAYENSKNRPLAIAAIHHLNSKEL